MNVLDWSLLAGWLPVVVGVLGAVALAWLLIRRERRWWCRQVPIVVAVTAVITTIAVVAVDRVWRPFPDALPLPVVLWVAAGLLGVVAAVLRWRSSHRVLLRSSAVCAAALVILGAASGLNEYYGQYPTVGAALGAPLPNEIDLGQVSRASSLVAASPGKPLAATWAVPAGMPATGAVTTASIPGSRSGFAARPGWIYLPPAYLASPRARLPVLVLLAGQPGSPRDWFDGGRLAQRLDRFAAAHAGLAPVVVVPDDLGASLANPLCQDSRLGQVATYLDTDVPAWIRQNLQVDPNPRVWAIGGFSHGGTCALQIGLRAPTVYPTLLDISGQQEPTLGSRSSTVQAAFGGDERAFRAANPLDLLSTRRYPDTAATIVVGEHDTVYRPQQERVDQAVRAAGAHVRFRLLPGGHTWAVWGPGLDDALPWLATRQGLTG